MAGVYKCGPVPKLQTQIFLNLIAKLEDYSANYLWLLPLRLREELLLNLPIADVCNLEQTRFVDGLDMDRVWVTLTQERIPRKLLQLQVSPVSRRVASYKEFYMEVLSLVILNRTMASSLGHHSHYHLALDLMFSVRGCLGIKHWSKFLRDNTIWARYFRPGFQVDRDDSVIPKNRYLFYYSRGISDTDLVHLLVNKCHYYPAQVNILTTDFILDVRQNEKMCPTVLKLFREFTRKANTLWFRIQDDELYTRRSVNAFLFTTTEILDRNNCHLQNLCIQAPNMRSLENHVVAIAPYFSPPETFGTFQAPALLHSSYTNLRELALIVGSGHGRCSPYLYKAIAAMIHHQLKLEVVMFSGFDLTLQPYSSNLKKIVWALLQHIRHPSFEVLHFSCLSVSFAMLQLFTEAFLTSQPKGRQLLHLSSVDIQEPNRPFYSTETMSQPLIMHKECITFKHLRISHVQLSPPVLSWLFSPSHHFQFNTLELHAVEVQDKPLLGTIARHPNLAVENLYISSLVLPHSLATAEDLHLLLTKDRLKTLAICSCNLGPSHVLQDLTYALKKRSPRRHTKLQVLALLDNKIGRETDTAIEQFFGALFILPYLQNLAMDIRENELKPRHFSLLCGAWRRYSQSRRLKVLQCGRNQLPGNKSDLQRVAQWLFM